jgi:programmed cell death 6-interacting protein
LPSPFCYCSPRCRLAGSSDDARIKLRQWELPDLLVALDSGSAAGLPDALRADLEELSKHNGSLTHLNDISVQIGECRRQAEASLASAEDMLKGEAKEDAELRDQFKERWKRPPSEGLTAMLWERIAGYRANLKQAAESDNKVRSLVNYFSQIFPSCIGLHWVCSI